MPTKSTKRAEDAARTSAADTGAGADAAVPQRPRWLVPSAIGISILGVLVSAYLTYEHATENASLLCTDSGAVNCVKVTTSQWSKVLGIPVAYLGLLFFVGMLAISLPMVWRRYPALDRVRLAAAGVGMLFVLYLLWAEFFKINAICIWCTAVHILTFLLLITLVVGAILTIPADEE